MVHVGHESAHKFNGLDLYQRILESKLYGSADLLMLNENDSIPRATFYGMLNDRNMSYLADAPKQRQMERQHKHTHSHKKKRHTSQIKKKFIHLMRNGHMQRKTHTDIRLRKNSCDMWIDEYYTICTIYILLLYY